MAKKVSIEKRTKSGDTINLYGELVIPNPVLDWNGNDISPDTVPQVSVYTKHAHFGYYNLERFENGELTAGSFRKMFGDKDND